MVKDTDNIKPKMQIVFLATFWGTNFGGINCFNMDICNAIAKHHSDKVQVICVVLNKSLKAIEGYKNLNIKLISIGIDSDSEFHVRHLESIEKKFKEFSIDTKNIAWWIGHDVVSGEYTSILRDYVKSEGKVAIIHHMNYKAYKSRLMEYGDEAARWIEIQRDCLKKADLIFGIGPYLTKTAKNISGKKAICLIPGIDYNANIKSKMPDDIFSAITFGRFDSKTDILKKSSLAVRAMGKAYKDYHSVVTKFEDTPEMCVVGIDNINQKRELEDIIADASGIELPIITMSYIEDRKKLLEFLSEFDLCMVLSSHEGFSLAGWEAIAMEVPIIISENTGLYKFLEKGKGLEGFAKGCIQSVIIGKNEENNVNIVATKLGEMAKDTTGSRQKIRKLKKLIFDEGYTWEKTARDFIKCLEAIPEMGTECIIAHGRGKSDYYCQKENLTYPETLKWLGEWKDLHNKLHDTFEKMRSFTKCINSLSEKVLENLSEQDVFYLENYWEDFFNSVSPIIKIIENLSPLEDNNLTLLFENLKDKTLKYNAILQDNKWNNINEEIGAKKFLNKFKGDSVEFDDFINKILYLTDQEIVYLVNFLKNRGENGTSIS
ncbi:MAG: glycosyltransferase [Acidobacteria bacterium]|nr:glycosyltransferase [Acidobacteriota bacterium]